MRHPSRLDKNPMACRLVRRADEMFDSCHYTTKARFNGRGTTTCVSLFLPILLPLLSLSLTFFLGGRGSNGVQKVRENVNGNRRDITRSYKNVRQKAQGKQATPKIVSPHL
jgi:hypothetical protein